MISPFGLSASPLAPLEFSKKVETLLSGATRTTRLAWVSVNNKLPSEKPIGPSVPLKPLLINSMTTPPAATPGIGGVTGSSACTTPANAKAPNKE